MPPLSSTPLIEVAVDSLASALAAVNGGADRLELAANLTDGGTTPSAGLIEMVRSLVEVDIFVLIRPRRGDFLYAHEEINLMKRDIQFAKSLGANGIVAGALTADGQVDQGQTAELVAAAYPLPFTFHRAFDMVADPALALEHLVGLGCARVLSSGQASSAHTGRARLAQLVAQASDRLIVMPGAGIGPHNIAEIWAATQAHEFHLSAKAEVDSGMRYRNPAVAMGTTAPLSEFAWFVTNAGKVAAVRQVLTGPRPPSFA
jgi:copper homeostasis protein